MLQRNRPCIENEYAYLPNTQKIYIQEFLGFGMAVGLAVARAMFLICFGGLKYIHQYINNAKKCGDKPRKLLLHR